jgi:hypothetical protein
VREARYVRDYVIRVRFNDGAEDEVDLDGELEGEVSEPLRDLAAFKCFKVDQELEIIVWENGAKLAPEFWYEKKKVLA